MIHDQRPNGDPETQPLSGILFQLHLQCHNLTPLDVARISGVRYLTIWKMIHALPMRREDALLVRRGLFRLTGAWYAASIRVHTEVTPTMQ